ncbi:MAG: hypothetical protein KGJ79_07465 [Alphaproteobacteria bacterium]|nr:hypothetical protein [Alphaproteobacteria bacterium]MDE2110964.1 hypothetical protein [Alphaproteobacteria bacterium]MDE2493649.1 hypothetical protein [Alphaproteobacteria bacterium]
MAERPDIKTLWRNQKTEDTVTLENIHEKAGKFQRRIHNRNRREYIGVVIVVLVFGWYVWALPGWMTKAGSALAIVAALFVAWQLHRRAPARKVPDGSGMGLVDFHRRELVRQRDALRSIWLWYILPFMPGIMLMMLGRWFQFHAAGRPLDLDHLIIVLCTVIVALVFGIVWLLNVLGAARLQRKIDDLDKLKSE